MSEKKVYVVTPKGNAELMGAGTSLTPDELKLLVLVNGIANVEEISRNPEHGLPAADVVTMLDKLAKAKFIADPDATAAINVGDFFSESAEATATLQANGFFVRIARKGADRKPGPAGQKITIVAIEDDPQLAKLLKMYLNMEGFAIRIAASGAEITKALGTPPKPELVLLDVQLPDQNGFDVLARMRADAELKDVPVIMATARATREAVLAGLRGGADGYITKPYDMEVVLKAIKTVLGIRK